MRKARVQINSLEAGILRELADNKYCFIYNADYQGPPVSLTMPIKNRIYEFSCFPSFFEGLLPEGVMLDALLRAYKLDKSDYFGQLLKVGHDVVGAVTIEEIEESE
jgi:serine/threonine-protein kinase HipA